VVARIAIAVGWVAALAALTQWGETTWAIVAAFAVTLAAGALVARWWILLVPAAVALVVAAWTLIDGDTYDASPADYAISFVMAGAFVAFVLAAGVAAGKLLRR
jgi:hypothetical protein